MPSFALEKERLITQISLSIPRIAKLYALLLCRQILCSWEVYWDKPKGSFLDDASDDSNVMKATILNNVLLAAKQAGIEHLVVVDDGSWVPQLEVSGIPYTCIMCPAPLTNTPNFNFKEGLVSDLSITAQENTASADDDEGDSVCREDLAALCVQSLQSLSWSKSRKMTVLCKGSAKVPALSSPPKRVDQQWCVNSIVLEEKLGSLA